METALDVEMAFVLVVVSGSLSVRQTALTKEQVLGKISELDHSFDSMQ